MKQENGWVEFYRWTEMMPWTCRTSQGYRSHPEFNLNGTQEVHRMSLHSIFVICIGTVIKKTMQHQRGLILAPLSSAMKQNSVTKYYGICECVPNCVLMPSMKRAPCVKHLVAALFPACCRNRDYRTKRAMSVSNIVTRDNTLHSLLAKTNTTLLA